MESSDEECRSSSITEESAVLGTRSLLHRLCHWGPIIAMGVIFAIDAASTVCLLQWWPPFGSLPGFANFLVYLFWNFLTLANFFTAAHMGPGYVPLRWEPEKQEHRNQLQYCSFCDGYKAPRSHHCRKCNRCVMRMDHHCPWINNCTGHFNQVYFIKFLVFAVLGCIHASIIIGCSAYRAIFRVWYLYYGSGKEPVVQLSLYGLLLAVFAFGLAIGVVCAVGFLAVVQIRIIWRNRTAIEDWIILKAENRERDEDEGEFVYPYDLGWRQNLKQYFTWTNMPLSNGFTFPVVKGCDQFSLTREQLIQKEIKKQLVAQCTVVRNYAGSFLPITHGCRVGLCPPFGEESRLALKVGDTVLVSRWRKRWVYGELVANQDLDATKSTANGLGQSVLKQRGWFPRHCVVRIEDNEFDLPKLHQKSD